MYQLGLQTEEINTSVSLLCDLLNEQFMLFGNILNAHWNIEGQNFIALHQLLETHYEFVKERCDTFAERVRVFGIKAPAHPKGNFKKTISDIDEKSPTTEFINKLSNGYERIICSIRDALKQLSLSNDFGTKSLLEDTLIKYEKIHWELVSNL
jgi:starvation-inducible DNA-binding protein